MPAVEQRLVSDRLCTLLRVASIETTARAASVEEAIAARLPPNASVYITALPGDLPEATLAAAKRLFNVGLKAVPHLAARHFRSQGELENLLARLRDDAGVDQLLLVGGDVDRARGPFNSSLELLRTGLLEQAGIRHVGVAAYPEGHPRISSSVLDAALAAKIDCLHKAGLSTYVITQFCFSAQPILDWLSRFSMRFGRVPVHVGLTGPAGVSTLLKYGLSCGVGPSLRALRRNKGLTKLLYEVDPAPVMRVIAEDKAASGCVTQFHFFTFGGVWRTAEWIHEMAADIALPRSQEQE